MGDLSPELPAGALGRREVVHDAHEDLLSAGVRQRGWQRHTAVPTKPVRQVLQCLEDVVANLLGVVVGDDRGGLEVGRQDTPGVARVVWRQPGDVRAEDEGEQRTLLIEVGHQ